MSQGEEVRMTKKLLMGNEAFAHAALQAGVAVVAGYPGTPSSEVIETVAKLRAAGRAEGVYVEWSTNEKCALELLAGASYTGARTLFTCKQVGLNVASDALMSLNYVGVKGGMVLFVADDPGPISSQTEQDTRRFAAFAKVPVLDPATPEQGFSMMQAAFELSERFGTPVIVRPTTRVCHASTFFDVADATLALPVPEEGFRKDPRWVIFPKRAYQAHGEINERLRQMAVLFADDPTLAAFNPIEDVMLGDGACRGDGDNGMAVAGNGPNVALTVAEGKSGEGIESDTAFGAPPIMGNMPLSPFPVTRFRPGAGLEVSSDPRLGIVAGGVSAAYAREALRMLRKRAAEAGSSLPPYRFWQVGTPYPFPNKLADRFLDGLDQVLVLEELDHVLEDALLVRVGQTGRAVTVRGKLTGDARDRGENDVDDILERIAAFFGMSNAEAAGSMVLDAESARSAAIPKPASQVDCDARSSAAATDIVGAKGVNHGDEQAKRFGEQGECPSSAIAEGFPDAPAFDAPVRPPVLCPGCPHRGSFYAVKRALGRREAVLCGDIGCYTLGNAQPLDAVDTCLCMGAGITMAQGFSVAEPQKKAVAFVGDSTFFASGLPGMVNAVYNDHDITLVVLDNATTAMTGSQPHPGTGVTLMGQQHDPVQIRWVLEAIGVQCVVEADPLNLDAAVAAAKQALDFEGPSAVLYVSPCVQLVAPEAPFRVDTERCTGCKRCITTIGCPAIGFDRDLVGSRSGTRGQAFVDDSLCNGCGLCAPLCPTSALRPQAEAAAGGSDGAKVGSEAREGGVR